MSNMIFRNYDKIDLTNKRGRDNFVACLNHFMVQPKNVSHQLKRAGVSEFTTAENFPVDVLNVIEKYHIDIQEIDTGYETAFDIVDLTNTRTSTFTLRDVRSGLTFEAIQNGQKAKTYSITGDQVTINIDLYGGGLDWMRTWFLDNQWYLIEDNAKEFRFKWYNDKATVIYGLFEACTGVDEAFSAAGANQIQNDIDTLNNAALTLTTSLITAGFSVTANSQLVLLTPLAMRNRVKRALAATGDMLTTAGFELNHNVTPVFTSYLGVPAGLAAAPLGYLVLPGRKNKLAERMPLTVMAETDILSFSDTTVGWGRYVAAVECDQVIRALSV